MDGPDPNSSALRWFEPPARRSKAHVTDPWPHLGDVAEHGTWDDVEAAWTEADFGADFCVRLAARLRLARSTSYLTGEPPVGAANGDRWQIGDVDVDGRARRELRFAAEAALERIADGDDDIAAAVTLTTLGPDDGDRRRVHAAVAAIPAELAAAGGARLALIDGDLDNIAAPTVARWAPHQLWRLHTAEVGPTRIAVVVPAALVDIGSDAGAVQGDDTLATLDLAAALWQPWQPGPLGTASGAVDAARNLTAAAA